MGLSVFFPRLVHNGARRHDKGQLRSSSLQHSAAFLSFRLAEAMSTRVGAAPTARMSSAAPCCLTGRKTNRASLRSPPLQTLSDAFGGPSTLARVGFCSFRLAGWEASQPVYLLASPRDQILRAGDGGHVAPSELPPYLMQPRGHPCHLVFIVIFYLSFPPPPHAPINCCLSQFLACLWPSPHLFLRC